MSDELLVFSEEETIKPDTCSLKSWKVMIVDDDEEVHIITKMVLSEFQFAKKKIKFLSAYSGNEAIKLIEAHPDTALIFLDVVMETDDSGLKVARYIREVLGNYFVRIILRTGQPGQAPEERIISEYEINDYKEKTELTARKLFTTTMAAIRSYRDLIRIDQNRKGLEKIINSSKDINKCNSLNAFISGVLQQLTSILGMDNSAFYYQMSSFVASKYNEDFLILSGTGEYESMVNQKLHDIKKTSILKDIDHVIAHHKNEYYDNHIILYFQSQFHSEHLIYMENKEKLDTFDIELIEIFIANASVAYDNIYLNQENESTQREIIFSLGELTEARSKEVGNHVKRVAEYCRLLARAIGMSEEDSECIYIASSMHDVGKVAVPDSILNKPGKLELEEFEVIKTHTTMGYEMLKNSNRPVMKMAAIIAIQHHEKYNGTGYPAGLMGEEIDIAGRIVAIADVFDALGTERVYKKAWGIEEILEYMKNESGVHFDPELIEILLNRVDEFKEIRTEFADKRS